MNPNTNPNNNNINYRQHILKLYDTHIFERARDLIHAGKTNMHEWTNFDLAKIFEYYTCLVLSRQRHDLFLEYNDIDQEFKEKNQMSRHDTGIDASNMRDTIVQCKLRKESLNLRECATFLSSQNFFNEQTEKTEIRWPHLILARNSDSNLSENLQSRKRLFEDMTFSKDSLLSYCQELLSSSSAESNSRAEEEPPKQRLLRYYQKEAIEIILQPQKNSIICLPTGTGKNAVMIHSIKPGKKYLILVPRIILMEQMKSEIISWNPKWKTKIQCIGDGQHEFNDKKDITICVYNSVQYVADFAGTFEKIFVDEAHRISHPKIYELDDEDYDYSHYVYEDDDDDDSNLDEAEGDYEDEDYDSEMDDFDDEDDEEESTAEESQEEEEEDDEEIKKKDQRKIIKTIRSFQQFNNNVYLSATIDDDKEEGFLFYKKDIADMIEEGFLADYIVHIPIFNDDPTNKNICEHLVKNYRSIIVFCKSHKEGMEINKLLNQIQPRSAEYIDCHTTKRKRDEILNRFETGELSFVVNVRVLTEGYNCPRTKGCFFVHLPSSKTTIIQIIGRALRLHPEKTVANIILPFSSKEDEKPILTFLKEISRNDRRVRPRYENKVFGGYLDLQSGEDGSCEGEGMEEEEKENDIAFRYNLVYNSSHILINGDEIWDDNLESLKKFIDEESRLPSYHSSREIKEKRLGKWLSHQKQNYKNKTPGMKDEIRYTRWIDFTTAYKDYFKTDEEKWSENFEKLIRFIIENKRRPNGNIKNEKILSNWFSKNSISYKKRIGIMKDIFYQQKWKEELLNKFDEYLIFDLNQTWNQNLEDVKQYIDKHGEKPRLLSKIGNENRLAHWILTNKNSYKNNEYRMKEISNRTKWEEFMTQYYEYLLSSDERWYRNLELTQEFINKNKIRPSASSKNNEEKRLGKWLIDYNLKYKTHKCILKKEDARKKWEEFINSNKEYLKSDDEKWNESFEGVKEFIEKHKKRPSRSSTNKQENYLGGWLCNQNKNYKSKKESMKYDIRYNIWTNFLNHYKDYFLSDDESWYRNLELLIEFMNKHKKRPSSSSKNQEEIFLSQFINRTNRNIHKNKYDHNQIIKWEEFINSYKEYLKSDTEIWDDTFEKLKEFINQNKKRPSASSKNKEENSLGSWMCHQSKYYCENTYGMKDQDRKNKWKEFINSFKEYLKSDQEMWEENLNNLKEFIDKNNKTPYKEDKKLCKWLSHQKQYYKNKTEGMKDEERYNTWTAFITEYKQYF